MIQPCQRCTLCCCCCLQLDAASQALATLCGEKDGIRDLTLPQHWMRDFFLAHLCLEMQHNAEGLSRLQVQHFREAPCLQQSSFCSGPLLSM